MKTVLLVLSFLAASVSYASIEVGKAAPNFTEKDQEGKTHSLKDFKGQWLVLEWFNEGCPYVKKHYESNNMQKLQKMFTGKGVKWLTVATSAKGKQGYVAPADAKAQIKRSKMQSTALLLDADGTMGKSYGAKTTPHMFIINPQGKVAYAGAIDSNNSANPATIKSSTNYVADALNAALAGKSIKTAATKPYGCSVKYK